jgi:hypothetical protein
MFILTGPRWIGRRADVPKDGPIKPSTQAEKQESTVLCTPSDLVAKACVGDIHAISPDKSVSLSSITIFKLISV